MLAARLRLAVYRMPKPFYGREMETSETHTPGEMENNLFCSAI
jgi:hypothetical protein